MKYSSNKATWVVYLFIGITITLWASAFVGIRASLEGYSPGVLALLRYGVASMALLPIYLKFKSRRHVTRYDVLQFIFAGVVGFSIYNLSLNYGEMTVSASIASFIVSLIPVCTVILAVIFLGERPSWVTLMGMFVSILGITIIAVGEHAGVQFDVGVLLVLLTAICGAGYSVMQKRLVSRFHPIEITTYAIWISVIPLLYFLPDLISEMPKASISATLSAVYLGIFPGAIAYLLWSYVLSHLPVSKTSISLYGMPIMATFIEWVWLGTLPSWVSYLGGLVALTGAVIVHFSRVHQTHQPSRGT